MELQDKYIRFDWAVKRLLRHRLLRINEINTAIHTTAATPIAPYLMNFFLRSLSRTSLGISLSITYCNFIIVIFVLKNKQHPCQESNLLIINNK